MKVGVDQHRGSTFVKLPSSLKNMSSITSDTLWFGCMGGMGNCGFGDF